MTYRNINLSEYQRRNIDLPEYRPVGLTTFRNSDLNLILEKRGKRKKGLLAGKNELKGNLSGYRFLFNHSLQNSFSRLCFKRTNVSENSWEVKEGQFLYSFLCISRAKAISVLFCTSKSPPMHDWKEKNRYLFEKLFIPSNIPVIFRSTV